MLFSLAFGGTFDDCPWVLKSKWTVKSLNFNQVISNLLMSALISVGPSGLTVLKSVLTMKPVLTSATKTLLNVWVLVLVRLNVRLVVTNVSHRFVSVEAQRLVLITSNVRNGSLFSYNLVLNRTSRKMETNLTSVVKWNVAFSGIRVFYRRKILSINSPNFDEYKYNIN